jgi:Eco57I restriction-modification methylase
MAFDDPTRNRLARFVGKCRDLLSEEFTRQLQSIYGIDPETGEVAAIESLSLTNAERETARLLRETMEHYLASLATSDSNARFEVLDRIVREQAFTVLNRLCALRMAEARGLLIESISKGYQSKGFQLYLQLASTALGERGNAYSCFLFSLFDEFAVDLPVLFDRFSPQGRLFPRDTALLVLLDEINHADIDPLWAEDETIGWIYQYFNSIEERKAMRAASQAPRNSRELAVRNQFFTPRYVVEFLTDNTLGRIWYEMTKGQTGLKDSCRYLVRRPTEIFLAEGEEAPEQEEAAEDLSQEELLKQPVYITHRPLKDPRDIKMLDPACGSMHFGLYAFDLFERIYEEAWDLEAEHGADAFARPEGFKPLHETYASKVEFLRDVPRLVIERNIHGIDIDPRAVQIAGLSLWLRAQKSWQAMGLAPQDRPQIQRSNIVCAEPMPGEEDMLEEFLAGLRDDRLESLIRRVLDVPENQHVRATARMAEALCDLVHTVWKEMELAGEVGSLLKIEESLADAIAKGKEEWEDKFPLFRVQEFGLGEAKPKTSYVKFIRGEEEGFWNRAEALVLAALENYAEHAQGTTASRQRMFAQDAARGFAFIDARRRRYDVVLANPPFGSPPASSAIQKHINRQYKDYKKNLACAFILAARHLSIADARVGLICDRSIFFRKMYAAIRATSLACEDLLFADLGWEVMDDANVEAAAFVESESRRNDTMPAVFFDARFADDRAFTLGEQISTGGRPLRKQSLRRFPNSAFAHWVLPSLLDLFARYDASAPNHYQASPGMSACDSQRFLRLWWEVPFETTKWITYAHGGKPLAYARPHRYVINWENEGAEVKAYIVQQYPYLEGDPGWVLKNEDAFFRPGLTYGKRTMALTIQALPAGSIFSDEGQAVFPESSEDKFVILGYLNTRIVRYLINCYCGQHKHSGYVNAVPWIELPGSLLARLNQNTLDGLQLRLKWECQTVVTSRHYRPSSCDGESVVDHLRSVYSQWARDELRFLEDWLRLQEDIEMVAGLSASERQRFVAACGGDPLAIDSSESTEGRADYETAVEEDDEEDAELIQLPRTHYSPLINECNRIGVQLSEFSAAIAGGHADQTVVLDGLKRVLDDTVGIALGRWTANPCEREQSELQIDPFAQLSYPEGEGGTHVLVSDPSQASDIVTRVRAILTNRTMAFSEDAEAELVTALGAKSLRVHFDDPNRFFAQHLASYSHSRRYAPLYWPLSTKSGSYTLWLLYRCLTDQSLYTCVNDFVEPKLKQVAVDAARLRSKTNRSSTDEMELERLTELEAELKDLRDELLRIAKFWKPNLNDGVQITAAPLWKLFQHKPWQKRLKETWEKLEAGEYDWAHLALSIWPDRVVRASHKDRSYAIAHDLEDQLWEEVEVEKKTRGGKVKKKMEWRPRELSEHQLNEIVAEVKAR